LASRKVCIGVFLKRLSGRDPHPPEAPERCVEPLAERHAVELVLHGPMKPLVNSIGLRRVSLVFGMIDVLDGPIELVFAVFAVAASRTKIRAPLEVTPRSLELDLARR
jgi:hypothetical protein